MSFDPITIALCKGKNSVGDVTLPYVNLTTPIEFGQTIRLSAEESYALCMAYEHYSPAVVFLNLDVVGTVAIPFSFAYNVFIGSIFASGSCIMIKLNRLSDTVENPEISIQQFHYWEVETSGGILNPLE